MTRHDTTINLKSKTLLFVLTVYFIIFSTITYNVYDNGFWTYLDKPVNSWASSIQTNMMISLADILAYVFDTVTLLFVSLPIMGLLWYRKYRKDSIFFGAVMLSTAIILKAIKWIIQRERPIDMITIESGFSFPSGHATTAVVFFALLSYLAVKHVKSTMVKTTIIVSSLGMVILISLSRLYLNVHWLSDILGGLVLGILILTGSILMQRIIRSAFRH